MTTITTADVTPVSSSTADCDPGATTPATASRTALVNLLRSEWAKTKTVRSSYWCVLLAAAAMALGTVITAVAADSTRPVSDPVALPLGGVLFAQLAIGVLAVLIVTTEYSTGMIRSTFIATPQRRSVIATKAAVAATIAVVTGTVASLATFVAGQAILGPRGVSLADHGALRSVIGVGLYLGLIAVLAVGIGTIVRSSVGAIAIVFGLLFVLPQILSALPSLADIAKLLPSTAGQSITHTVTTTTSLSPWIGLGVCGLFAAVTFAVSLTIVQRRDA